MARAHQGSSIMRGLERESEMRYPGCAVSAGIPSIAQRTDLMLLFGRHRTRTCQGPSRRELLQAGASAVLGLALPDLLRMKATGGVAPSRTAKSVLMLWLWGGPAQLDTWDPKP